MCVCFFFIGIVLYDKVSPLGTNLCNLRDYGYFYGFCFLILYSCTMFDLCFVVCVLLGVKKASNTGFDLLLVFESECFVRVATGDCARTAY